MATNLAYIHIGQGDVWVGGTPPLSGSDPNDPTTSGINSMTTNYAAPTSGGTQVGFTLAPAVLSYKPTYYMVVTEQAFAEVVVIPTAEETTLDLTLGELSYTNLATSFGQGTTHVAGGANAVHVGGKATVTQSLVAMNSRKRSGTGYYITTIYQTYSQDGAAPNFERRKETQLKVMLRALAVTTRPVGDQLFQIAEYGVNPP